MKKIERWKSEGESDKLEEKENLEKDGT